MLRRSLIALLLASCPVLGQERQDVPYPGEVAAREAALGAGPVSAVTVSPQGQVYAATSRALKRRGEAGAWSDVAGVGSVLHLAASARGVFAATPTELLLLGDDDHRRLGELEGAPTALAAAGDRVVVATRAGLFEMRAGRLSALHSPLGKEPGVRQIALGPKGELVVAAAAGVFEQRPLGWRVVRAGPWSLADARGACFDAAGRLWVATPQGVAVRAGDDWRRAPSHELPWNGFTALAPGRGDGVWLGTDRGAIRPDGEDWAYRHGKRWLPADGVRAIATDSSGTAWFATEGGLGSIAFPATTLAAKAQHLWRETDLRHRRTELGYVTSVDLKVPGDPDSFRQRDSDNDGLWTALYGAAACYAFANDGEEAMRARAQGAFRALRFLSQVTQGTERSPAPGFPARTVVPTSGHDPNAVYTLERDRKKQGKDRLWKAMHPRWPKSADGAYYWKCDTSSDELNGHFFFYSRYHDLVCKTDAERAEVRAVVTAIMDHLLENGLRLVDWDGKPTRWANFSPESLNRDPDWHVERGLNSASALSFLAVASHVSGDPKYAQAARKLVDEHGYAQNATFPKVHAGPGTGNQSDDQLAVLAYHTLLLHERDPALRSRYATGFRRLWELIRWERSPFFAAAYAAVCAGESVSTPWGDEDLSPSDRWLDDAIDGLRRFPRDRTRWGIDHTHRLDLFRLLSPDPITGDDRPRGRLRDGRALPVDERYVEKWNHDPWRLRVRGDGRRLADGVAFLLPYGMARHHRLLR